VARYLGSDQVDVVASCWPAASPSPAGRRRHLLLLASVGRELCIAICILLLLLASVGRYAAWNRPGTTIASLWCADARWRKKSLATIARLLFGGVVSCATDR
jgi:hypothetical protein